MSNIANANVFLLSAALLNALVAFAHLGCIVFGASWYRFFGAGEQMAVWAEQGNIKSSIITLCISFVLFSWSAYALSASGGIIKFPLIKLVLISITSIYLMRGIGGFFLITNPLGREPKFWFWSSVICLSFAIIHGMGLKQIWSTI